MRTNRQFVHRCSLRQAVAFVVLCLSGANTAYGCFFVFTAYVKERAYIREMLYGLNQVTVGKDGTVVLRVEATYSVRGFVWPNRSSVKSRYLIGSPQAVRQAGLGRGNILERSDWPELPRVYYFQVNPWHWDLRPWRLAM